MHNFELSKFDNLHQHYQFNVIGTSFDTSVVKFVSQESLNEPYEYAIEFTSSNYAYRPKSQARPTISGTIPATISSRNEEDTYAWLDEHGRYRVKFNFDLNTRWKKGFESLWVRLAKPYSGDTYGFHFPLVDGIEVAIAFAQGDPDRPYIAYAMHNLEKSDHVTKANHTRNVIRIPPIISIAWNISGGKNILN